MGLVARQRRLLRAVYLLADAGMRLEASYMVRAMTEFLIRQKWLESDPRRNQVLWAADDLEARMRIDRELRELVPDEHGEAVAIMTPERRAQYEAGLEAMRQDVRQGHEELGAGGKPPKYPNLREQAHEVGLDIAYSLAYRSDSLLGHPTAHAIEQLFEEREDGIRVTPDPAPDRSYADPYSVAVVLLRDALASAAALNPELRLEGFDEVVARLDALHIEPGADARDDDEPAER